GSLSRLHFTPALRERANKETEVSIDLFETAGSSPPKGATAVAELESHDPALEAAEAELEAPCRRHRLTPPPPAECVRILRARYPESLVCVTCGTLLASEAKGYAKSNLSPTGERVPLTEEQRLTYACGECRWEAAEAAKRAEMNRQKLVLARGARA